LDSNFTVGIWKFCQLESALVNFDIDGPG